MPITRTGRCNAVSNHIYRDPASLLEITDGVDPGEVIGYTKRGMPIFSVGGGAEADFTHWIPEEFASDVITRVNQVSAVESMASRIPMGSATKSVPRSAGMGVDYTTKGTAYGEDTTANDEVILTARKFGKAIRVAEEDLTDSLANIIATKQRDWATSYAKMIDNSSLAVTAAAGAGVPFNSVYYALTQTDAATGYTANRNLTQSATASYASLNTAMGLLEDSDYFDDSRVVAIAHPKFRKLLRGILDGQNRPIFIDYGTQHGGDIQVNGELFGAQLKWSLGAKTSPTATSAPGGNPLIVFANLDYANLGIRSGPESAFAGADTGVGFLTDDALLKMRARRGFAVGNEFAFSIFEYQGP